VLEAFAFLLSTAPGCPKRSTFFKKGLSPAADGRVLEVRCGSAYFWGEHVRIEPAKKGFNDVTSCAVLSASPDQSKVALTSFVLHSLKGELDTVQIFDQF